VQAAPIREDDLYGGVRVRFSALLGKVRIPVQIDVGFGDAVTSEARVDYWKPILEFPPVRLRVYGPENVIAEKLHAAIILGTGNSRMKDFFDLLWLSRNQTFAGIRLQGAVQATFRQRATLLPPGLPEAFTSHFYGRADKQTQWSAFLRKSALAPEDFPTVIEEVARFVIPVLHSGVTGKRWHPETGWQEGEP